MFENNDAKVILFFAVLVILAFWVFVCSWAKPTAASAKQRADKKNYAVKRTFVKDLVKTALGHAFAASKSGQYQVTWTTTAFANQAEVDEAFEKLIDLGYQVSVRTTPPNPIQQPMTTQPTTHEWTMQWAKQSQPAMAK